MSPPPPLKSPLSFCSPEVCSGQTVFFLLFFFFCFLPTELFKRNIFSKKLFLFNVVWLFGDTLSLSLSLPPSLSDSLSFASRLRDQLFLHTYTDSLCFFFFTFCKLKEKQPKKTYKKDIVNKILTFSSWCILCRLIFFL